MTFSIRQARAYAQLTQAQMAAKIGVSLSTYGKLEANPDMATVRQIRLISEITSIPIENIFLGQKSTFVD